MKDIHCSLGRDISRRKSSSTRSDDERDVVHISPMYQSLRYRRTLVGDNLGNELQLLALQSGQIRLQVLTYRRSRCVY